MGIWDDVNQAISDTGILQTINPAMRDIVPGVAAVEDVFGMDPTSWGPTQDVLPGEHSPGTVIGGNAAPELGGASGGWGTDIFNSMMGGAMNYAVPAGLALSGPRRIYPYTGGMVPAGYRVANRRATRGSPARPAGTYLVPRRRMNPLNPHALMRAERRMSSFTHWVTRHFRIAAHAPRRKHKARFGRKKR